MGRPSMAPTSLDPPHQLVFVHKELPRPYAMNVNQAAAYIGLSAPFIRKAIYAGDLPSRKTCEGGVHLIQTIELEAWFHRLPPYFIDHGD